MADLALNLSTNELAMQAGDLVLVRGLGEVAQRVLLKLRLFRGEWYLDTRAGLPWFDLLGTKGADALAAIREEVRGAILGVDGVVRVEALSVTKNNASRRVAIACNIIGTDGEAVPIALEV